MSRFMEWSFDRVHDTLNSWPSLFNAPMSSHAGHELRGGVDDGVKLPTSALLTGACASTSPHKEVDGIPPYRDSGSVSCCSSL